MLSQLNHPSFHRLRPSQLWQEDLPFFAALLYGWGLVGGQPPKTTLWNMLLVAVAAVGTLVLVLLLKRMPAGPAQSKPKWSNGVLLLVALGGMVMVVLPWLFYFPNGVSTLGLLAGEVLLIALYYLPPFRLQRRGIWGMLCHAVFAQAIPAVLISLLLFYLGNRIYEHWWLLIPALGAWRFMVGFRKQLTHQKIAVPKPILLGVETLFFLGVVGLIAWETPLFLAFSLFYPLQRFYKLYFIRGANPSQETQSGYGDEFYAQWLPLIALAALMSTSWVYGALALIHLMLFPNAVMTLIQEYRIWMLRQRVKYSVLLLFFLMSGQMVQLLVTHQEYFPAFVLPMFSTAPEGEASRMVMEIKLLGPDQEEPLSLAEFLPALTESKRTVFVQRNMGPSPTDQNHEADFNEWLNGHTQTIRPGTPWYGVEVKWSRIGTVKTDLGLYRNDWSSQKKGHG